jgi:hypothetical protein
MIRGESHKTMIKLNRLFFLFFITYILFGKTVLGQTDSTQSSLLKHTLPGLIFIGIGAHGPTRAWSHQYSINANNQLIYGKNKWNIGSNIFPIKTFRIEDGLWALPMAPYALAEEMKLKSKNGRKQRFFLSLSAFVLCNTTVLGFKNIIAEPRPSDPNAKVGWPSGHTANAFTAATLMHLEYGKKYPWLSLGAYTTASAVGVLRIINNKHAMNQVVAGAGFGVLSSCLVYYINEKLILKKKKIIQ